MGYSKGQKAEDFIGWKSLDGKLEVIGIVEKSKGKLFKVTCTECSKDKELFPDDYFISRKKELLLGSKPCGCSKKPQWTEAQYLVKMARAATIKGFIVHGFAEEFHGNGTKVFCECPVDGYKWISTIHYIVNKKRGCHKCPVTRSKNTSEYAHNKCFDSCDKKGYKFIGFVGGYENNKSHFEYLCPKHGIQIAEYSGFVNHGTGCPECRETGYNPNKYGSFYIVRWRKDTDSFIKFGITNRKVIKRIKHQASKTEYKYEILFEKGWKDGSIAFRLEKSIKENTEIIKGVVDKEDFRDGFSETLEDTQLQQLFCLVFGDINDYGGGVTPSPQL